MLSDQNGVAHELHGLADAAAVVILVQGNGCPIVRNAWPTFRQIRESYRDRDVEFLLLNSFQDDRAAILVYRGPIDDRLTYDGQKPAATQHYLRDALDALLAGEPIAEPRREALGCLINFPNRRSPL
jgi:hypothetical protein